jgi:hypothetical protein
MGYTRTVRFVEPVDPRRVWSAVLAVIGAGADYPAGGYHTDTVLTVPTMYYGADGGPLFDDCHCDDYGPAGLPAGYVEVSFDSAHVRADAAGVAVDRLVAAVSVSAWWADDYAAEWLPVVR